MAGEVAERLHNEWENAKAQHAPLQLFALVDPAQDRRAIPMIFAESGPNECLFGYALDSPIAASTPRLVSLIEPKASRLLAWLLRSMAERPVATLLASTASLATLTSHLRRCVDVELEGLDSMYLAFWDPAILATLLGQPDDDTLHVPGPALHPEQTANLLAPLQHWWYCDRSGKLHDAVPADMRAKRHDDEAAPKMVLDAEQVNKLVEASVPDHLLQHIRQNQPELLERLPSATHYQFARQQLRRAREHGLEGTGDLVNYICLALTFGGTFDELPSMAALLAQVNEGSMLFDKALGKAPEDELAARAQAPAVL
jgi:hypothetical protein